MSDLLEAAGSESDRKRPSALRKTKRHVTDLGTSPCCLPLFSLLADVDLAESSKTCCSTSLGRSVKESGVIELGTRNDEGPVKVLSFHPMYFVYTEKDDSPL